ncbi:hypothetical protein ACWGCI_37120, partial [Streptomyces sp. NPDC054949]
MASSTRWAPAAGDIVVEPGSRFVINGGQAVLKVGTHDGAGHRSIAGARTVMSRAVPSGRGAGAAPAEWVDEPPRCRIHN